MKVRRIDREEFLGMREGWNRLLASSWADSPFLTWEWIRRWHVHFAAPGTEPCILVAEDGDGAAAILPACIRERSFLRPVLRLIGSEGLGCDYLDFIVRPGCDGAVDTLLDHIVGGGEGTGLARFDAMRSDSPGLARVRDYALRNRVSLAEIHRDVCPYLPIPAGCGGHLALLPPNLRSNIRKKANRIAAAGGRYLLAETPSDLERFFPEMCRLHGERRAQVGGGDSFSGERIHEFHLGVCRDFLERGWLHFPLLEIDGKVVAGLYCYAYGGRMYYFQAGLDPAYGSYSAGMMLIAGAVEHAARRGFREFDFLQGDEEYKRRWTRESRTTVSLLLGGRKGAPDLEVVSSALYRRFRGIARKVVKG